MNSNLPHDVKENLQLFGKCLSEVENSVQPLLDLNLSEISEKLTAVENARLNVVLSYTLNSLFYMYLKTQGSSPQNHPIKNELLRVQGYLKKVAAASGDAKKSSSVAQRKFVINKEASKRVIQHALAGNAAVDSKSANSKKQGINKRSYEHSINNKSTKNDGALQTEAIVEKGVKSDASEEPPLKKKKKSKSKKTKKNKK